MADERLKLVVDPAYSAALGMVLFSFAMLESQAIWCCEQIQPGSIEALDDRTAGNVADRLVKLIQLLPASPDRDRLVGAAARFRSLVTMRNSLFHAKPIGIGKTNILSRKGDPWRLDEISDAADLFAKCSETLSALLHSYLAPLKEARS